MYCKYCGNRIKPDTVQCPSCGAAINFLDGGQSFFEDKEIDAWRSGSYPASIPMEVPRTKMGDELQDIPRTDEDVFVEKKNLFMPASAQKTGEATRRRTERRRSSGAEKRTELSPSGRIRMRNKKKKTLWDYLSLSSSNKLIVFCIVSALAIVLLVVAIIAVLNSDGKDANTESGYTQQVATEGEQAGAVGGGEQIRKDIKKVDGFTVRKNGKKIDAEFPAYLDKTSNTMYMSVDRFLTRCEGYGHGNRQEDGKQIVYKHKSGKVIELVEGDSMIRVGKSPDSMEERTMSAAAFNDKDGHTCVPVESFLECCGYKYSWDPSTNTLTING